MAVPSRDLVYKELKALLVNAANQFPKLKGKEDYIIYGPAEKAYASFNDPKYFKYRGTEWDWQGLLGQKVPRFDNRIISKCKLIPRLNVCKANNVLNKEVTFLLELKNMRYTLKEVTSKALSCEQINFLFEKYKVNFSTKESQTNRALINSREWKKYIQSLSGDINSNQREISQPKLSGRSSFCKPALHILHSLILSGKNPNDYYKELVSSNKNDNQSKGLIKEDYKFLSDMPNGWNSISIQDTRKEDKSLNREQSLEKIDKIVGSIPNRIVRHRLLMLKAKLEELAKKYGEPQKIIFEIAREDFIGEGKKKEYEKFQNDNKKEIEDAIKILNEAGLSVSGNLLKARLFNKQKGEDIYDTSEKRKMIISKLDEYECDHIVPRERGGSDSYSNFVLTKRIFNQDKENLTPYEWFHKKRSEDWESYIKNVDKIFSLEKSNKKKINLLISDEAVELESRKTDLQATSQIEKFAQRLASLYFNWGMNTKGDEKRILFFTGGETASVRSSLRLNRILFTNLTDDEYVKQRKDFKDKNRKNKKHHALDALVLSILPEIKLNFKKVEKKPDFFNKEFCKNEISKVYPHTIKQIIPKLRETIYGLRYRFEKNEKTNKFEKAYYFVSHFDSSIDNFKLLEGKKNNDKSARKNVENIFSLKIKEDFQKILSNKDLTQEEWEKFLQNYTDGYKKIKKIVMIDSRRFKESEVFNADKTIKDVVGAYGHRGAIKGQWIRGKESHQGQIVYKDENGKWRIVPIYVFESEYAKRKEYKNKYKDVKIFKSGQLIELKKDFQDIQKGIYKLRTIVTNGRCKLENINDQTEILKSIEVFLDKCGMVNYEKQ
ncbi:MAG: hypothetical protein LBN01_04450 [Endomicrobium sp.]|nr:hypothetical protein [Endomicrobium sp.]